MPNVNLMLRCQVTIGKKNLAGLAGIIFHQDKGKGWFKLWMETCTRASEQRMLSYGDIVRWNKLDPLIGSLYEFSCCQYTPRHEYDSTTLLSRTKTQQWIIRVRERPREVISTALVPFMCNVGETSFSYITKTRMWFNHSPF